MFAFWGWSMSHRDTGHNFIYPSWDIEHSIEKQVFLDTLDIVSFDTIATNEKHLYVFPVAAWTEKMANWKWIEKMARNSGKNDPDSVRFSADTVLLMVDFETLIHKKLAKSSERSFDYNIVDFQDANGNYGSLHAHAISAMDILIPLAQTDDTIRLTTPNNEQIVLKKR